MNNIVTVKKLKFWLSIGLVYAILIEIFRVENVDVAKTVILLLTQVTVAFICGILLYEVTLNKIWSILIGVISLFFLINIFTIIYVLKKSNDYIKSSPQTEEDVK